ncbi:MAG TPA: caspase family protein [Nitrososphaeraceae archaeon]|nr:caspase family protein [Nitrososphaeraceae archaeon]
MEELASSGSHSERHLKSLRTSNPSTPGVRWAIIIGISKYKDSRLHLKYAHRDAEEFYNVITKPSGGGFEKEHICKLINEEATRDNINKALCSFLKKPAEDDLVLIYFACHGSYDVDRPHNVYLFLMTQTLMTYLVLLYQ